MRTQSYYILIFSFFIILCNSCGKINSVKLTKEVKQSNEIKYAKGFDIKHFSEYKKLIINILAPIASRRKNLLVMYKLDMKLSFFKTI